MSARESLARIHRVMAILSGHPNGLPLDAVARELGVTEPVLRREILDYYATDISAELLLGLNRADTIEFLAADGVDDDPHLAPMIRAVSDRPEAELGIEYVRADELVALYEAAHALAELEPSNAALRDAIDVLAESFLAGTRHDASGSRMDQVSEGAVAILREAIDTRRVIGIEYSRAWRPGVGSRQIHPYALRLGSRGWELDAGPLVDGKARTFIVDRISRADLLPDTFQRPEGIDEILAAERTEVVVDLSLPQRTQWVVDRFAETTAVLNSDADDLTVRAGFLPPVAERVGLVLIIAGPDAFVVAPRRYECAGSDLAQKLLKHHRLDRHD